MLSKNANFSLDSIARRLIVYNIPDDVCIYNPDTLFEKTKHEDAENVIVNYMKKVGKEANRPRIFQSEEFRKQGLNKPMEYRDSSQEGFFIVESIKT